MLARSAQLQEVKDLCDLAELNGASSLISLRSIVEAVYGLKSRYHNHYQEASSEGNKTAEREAEYRLCWAKVQKHTAKQNATLKPLIGASPRVEALQELAIFLEERGMTMGDALHIAFDCAFGLGEYPQLATVDNRDITAHAHLIKNSCDEFDDDDFV
ncbi:MAG: hypothetical protein IJU79_02255 [Desulfovibrionaceae bacterium]|nr:hypothetical protein [Desulfovibrionaceae bacterium]